MSDNYCYTHMPEGTGYCVYCDVEAKGNRIAELEADNERLRAYKNEADEKLISLTKELVTAYDRIEALESLVMKVAGWCYAEACMNLADGIDMREVAVPDFIDKMKKDIPEVAALKGDKNENHPFSGSI